MFEGEERGIYLTGQFKKKEKDIVEVNEDMWVQGGVCLVAKIRCEISLWIRLAQESPADAQSDWDMVSLEVTPLSICHVS